MAFISANPFSTDNNLLNTGTAPLPFSGGGALDRLGGGLPLACPCSMNSSLGLQAQMQQMLQLEMQMFLMLANLMLGGPNSTSPRGASPANGLSGGGLGFGTTPPQPGGKSSFNVSSFNVLGSSHTNASGNKPGMNSGVDRMRGAVAAMKSHNVDIAGMQEFQGDQQAAFKRLAPNFGVVGEKDNAIVYNKEKFRLVEKRSFSIPYFEGHKREMPIAKLEDKATGKQMWVVNIHNPADTKDHPHNAANRAKAIRIEQDLMRQLQATGLPVIFTGDFNDRKSVDGSMDRVGMDSAAPNKARSEIDYIFGSGVHFSNYTADHRTQSAGTSDHPLIVSTATI
ncbi:MAG: endonuclease/exonuclease/phosphatase family protein [Candidatus Eremiobacteraeota bacterium]|nr:endonuclease/exonuclease/phosphatase family protein [Candidatus Eremiobacteraeota bacterium]MCW5871692.1 endonuclease/exonuclease/phosphatase family protein [Candidatus Eremiobacteraeota bacterium]